MTETQTNQAQTSVVVATVTVDQIKERTVQKIVDDIFESLKLKFMTEFAFILLGVCC